MEQSKIQIEKRHILISADKMKISPMLMDVLYDNKHKVILELDGSYLNIMANNTLITRLGENEWMPLHQA